MKTALLLTALTLPILTTAHKHTAPDVQRALQAAAYQVGPHYITSVFVHSPFIDAVRTSSVTTFDFNFHSLKSYIADSQQFTAGRKRSWAQKVLGGRPSLAGYDHLFDSSTYQDIDATKGTGSGQKLLSCVEESETEILNNTCVLGTPTYFSSETK